MLVLSRKKHEEIVIDGPCVLSIVEIQGDKVRVGIEAPKSTKILRMEIAGDTTRTARCEIIQDVIDGKRVLERMEVRA